MIRLSLLQLRVQAITAAVAVTAFAVLLAATGPHLASMYASSGLRGCRPDNCSQLANSFLQQVDSTGAYTTVSPLSIILISLTPAVVGLFWGAPLIAHELETGTFALAWSQSVTRTRWLAIKLAVGVLAAMAATEALSLLFTWWAAPLSRAVSQGGSGNSLAMNQFNPLAFATHGITPLGYAAFAFALGVTLGALIRRTVPAMAVTLAIFAALQIAMPLWIRPNLLPASHTTTAITNDTTLNLYKSGSPHKFTYTLAADGGLPGQPEAWIRSSGGIARRQARWSHRPVQRRHRLDRASRQHSPAIGLLASGEQRRTWAWPGEVPGEPGHPARRHLPARQPVLALARGRDRRLPRPIPGPDRILLPAHQTPALKGPLEQHERASCEQATNPPSEGIDCEADGEC